MLCERQVAVNANRCSIPGCERKYNARGYCGKHYVAWRRHGNPLARVRVRNTCSEGDCDGAVQGHGYCSMHYARWRRYGDPSIILPHPGNTALSTGRISYDGAHHRIYRAKGKASGYVCLCGKQADEWAYDHADPNEWTAERPFKGREKTVAYSGDPDHYVPLCYRCHLDTAVTTRRNRHA